MQVFRILALCLLLGMFGLVGASGFARAAGFPDQALTVMIAFKEGEELGNFVAAAQPLLEKRLGQPLRLVYTPGNNGAMGWSELARSAPTGYVLGGINLPHIILQPLQRKGVGYATTDLKPVVLLMSFPTLLVVPKDSPYNSLAALLQAAREQPGSVILSGSGSSTAAQVAALKLNKVTGLDIPYLPFAGSDDALAAMRGQLAHGMMAYAPLAHQFRDEVKVLAVASEERLPDIEAPTFREQGFDLVERGYRGIAVPQKTPDSVVQTLYEAFAAVNVDPAFAQKMSALGFTLETMNPVQSAKFIEERTAVCKDLLKELVVRR